VQLLLAQARTEPCPHLLWKLQYKQTCTELAFEQKTVARESSLRDHVLMFPPLSADLALGDSVLTPVKEAWLKITSLNDEDFMVFGSSANEGQAEQWS